MANPEAIYLKKWSGESGNNGVMEYWSDSFGTQYSYIPVLQSCRSPGA
jgi:hypothetical protein